MSLPAHLEHLRGVATGGCVKEDRGSAGIAPSRFTDEEPSLRERIVAALRRVRDPELPINIYDLGLVYGLEIDENADVSIVMTLTAPTCPVAGIMPIQVRNAVIEVDGVGIVDVELVWEPPWSAERMSEEARLELGML